MTGVPTWNYAAVHVYGRVSLINDPEALRELVNRMSRHFEGDSENAWVPTYPDKMLEAITGFIMEVDEVQAKYKLSQNRSPKDRENVANALQASPAETDRCVATLMQK
ncbi:MAG TPA: FMN-binding negative transcriptional regulator [Candidatus Thiothrix moscowensis]|uniref:FMN-binding negative transcriptional regulator n=1 Tax=unclassified Thiothrix TaxID=2636184 RepID=UPI0025CEBAEA|nr:MULTISPECIES: FMN-binding negative transcriptional regulator [unclassified Thiothrix]HRJ51565.1 FMN-binding negative transcriptional regulator [Candidatus Thiothrix moscowensis]HRJ91880.1 FMN-binding negative transcriptional regulator [Candidatus Thiothrix moscowensis]